MVNIGKYNEFKEKERAMCFEMKKQVMMRGDGKKEYFSFEIAE